KTDGRMCPVPHTPLHKPPCRHRSLRAVAAGWGDSRLRGHSRSSLCCSSIVLAINVGLRLVAACFRPLRIQQLVGGCEPEKAEIGIRCQGKAQTAVVFDGLYLIRLAEAAAPEVQVAVEPPVLPDISPLTAGGDEPPALAGDAIAQVSLAE